MGKRVDVDVELLRAMYVDQGLSLGQIASQLGLKQFLVWDRLRKLGIQFRGRKKNRDDIEKMYLEERLSTRQIGKIVGLAGGAVYSILKVRGVPIRKVKEGMASRYEKHARERQAAKELIKANTPLPQLTGFRAKLADKEWLSLEVMGKTPKMIADELGCTEWIVRHALKDAGIGLADIEVDRFSAIEKHLESGGSPRARFGMLGKKQTDYQKASTSEANRGNKRLVGKHWKWSDEARQRSIGKPGTNTGKKFSEEHKAKLRASNIGQKRSDEFKQKMREIRSQQVLPVKDTVPERLLQEELTNWGLEYKKHVPLPGLPDLFLEPNICVFADGDYWHTRPGMKEKDATTTALLESKGYVVLRFWEKEIAKSPADCVDQILRKRNASLEKQVEVKRKGKK